MNLIQEDPLCLAPRDLTCDPPLETESYCSIIFPKKTTLKKQSTRAMQGLSNHFGHLFHSMSTSVVLLHLHYIMSESSEDRSVDTDDGENIDRDEFDVTLFSDYRDFYQAGLHRERTPVYSALRSLFSSNTHLLCTFSFPGVDILPEPNSFMVKDTSE